ncbi:hypothetical protein MNBD_GAMMA26-2450 [hydrothermal vent metagenome]|uniref:Polymerase nucleotidyl transferase domain-containing protein n=1 Tax=hydrothermal vent metagenome TaxID=652676 RepID=A0A3B1B3M8_9ZZZZ
MKPSVALEQYREDIRQIVARYNTYNARVFESVLTGHDTDTSDLDFLVDTTSDTTLMDIGAIRFELKTLLGVKVDVLTPNGLPTTFRDRVLKEALPV